MTLIDLQGHLLTESLSNAICHIVMHQLTRLNWHREGRTVLLRQPSFLSIFVLLRRCERSLQTSCYKIDWCINDRRVSVIHFRLERHPFRSANTNQLMRRKCAISGVTCICNRYVRVVTVSLANAQKARQTKARQSSSGRLPAAALWCHWRLPDAWAPSIDGGRSVRRRPRK